VGRRSGGRKLAVAQGPPCRDPEWVLARLVGNAHCVNAWKILCSARPHVVSIFFVLAATRWPQVRESPPVLPQRARRNGLSDTEDDF